MRAEFAKAIVDSTVKGTAFDKLRDTLIKDLENNPKLSISEMGDFIRKKIMAYDKEVYGEKK